MRILIANDDGIYSPGILALAECAADFGDVRIVAPDVEQSSMGHAITASRPLTYRRTPIGGFEAWRVNGTPADCVALGISQWEDIGIVLSGINLGFNLGNGCWHSGTLAAAKQAALLGMRGIALSTGIDIDDEPDFESIKPCVRQVLGKLIKHCDCPLLNVNFPSHPTGIRWTRQSVRHYKGVMTPGRDPLGHEHWWFNVIPIEETEEDTDRWAIQHDLASITPFRLDLTDKEELRKALERERGQER